MYVGSNYLEDLNYTKKCIGYLSFYLILSSIMLFADIIARNGNITLTCLLASSILIIFRFRTVEALFPFYIVLMMNNGILESGISLVGGISVGLCIKVIILILFLILLMRPSLRGKVIIPPWIYLIWGTYLVLNTIFNHVSDPFSVIFSLTSPMIISVTAQWIAGKKKKDYSCMIVASLVAALVISCFFGYFELLVGRTFYYSTWTGAERYRYSILRVGSTSSDPNFMCLTNITILALLNISRIKDLIGKHFWRVLTVLVSIQVFLTFSRAGILSLICVYLLMFSKKHRKQFVVVVPLLFVALTFAINIIFSSLETTDINSYLSRTRIIELSLQQWKKNPFFGYGYNGFYNMSSQLLGNSRSTMNEYLGELTSYGIIGLSLYLVYLYCTFKATCGSIRNLYSIKHDKGGFRICLFASLIAWCVMSASLDTYSKLSLWILPSVSIAVNSLKLDGEHI